MDVAIAERQSPCDIATSSTNRQLTAKSKIEDHGPTLTIFIIGLGLNFGGRYLCGRILKERPFRVSF